MSWWRIRLSGSATCASHNVISAHSPASSMISSSWRSLTRAAFGWNAGPVPSAIWFPTPWKTSPPSRQQQVMLSGSVEPGVDPVPMDSGKIGRVLANLIGNALRYTSPGGTVQIRAWLEDREARGSVRDTGIAIDSEDQPHVFERFYRGEKRAACLRRFGAEPGDCQGDHRGAQRPHLDRKRAGPGHSFTFALPR